jgi:hypothetical protein
MDISTGADDADEEDADDVDVGAGREQKAASAASTMAFTNVLLLLVRLKHRIRGHLKHGAAVKLNAGVLVVVALLHMRECASRLQRDNIRKGRPAAACARTRASARSALPTCACTCSQCYTPQSNMRTQHVLLFGEAEH